MSKKRFLYLLVITLGGYLLLSWFGILIGLLVYFFLQTIYGITFLKKEAGLFLHSGRSLTLSKKQKILLAVKYLCARCYPFLDDESLRRLLLKLKFGDSFFYSVEISFLQTVEADLKKIFSIFTVEECRFIFICFSALASCINKDLAHSFLLNLKSTLPESVSRQIILQNDLETYLPCYQMLDVEPGSKLEAIKKQYKKLAMNFHPDTSEALSDKQKTLSREAYLKIQDAYKKLLALYSSE